MAQPLAPSLLEPLGLSDDEQQGYLELLGHPGRTRTEFAASLPGWGAARAARSLTSLVDKGLAVRLAGTPHRFTAAPPDVALESIARSRIESLRRVQTVIPELMARYWQAPHHGASSAIVEILADDRESNDRRARQLMAAATHQVRAFERPPHKWESRGLDAHGVMSELAEDADIERQGLLDGVRYQVVYDQVEVDDPTRLPDIMASVAAGEDARVLDGLPLKLVLFDDWAATTPLLDPDGHYAGLLVVHTSPLLDALSALFDSYWDKALPLGGAGGSPAADTRSPTAGDPRDAQLLSLLAAGLTDDAIARHLGISRSTVQRRVTSLMAKHSARTRYQLGLQVARSG